MSTPAAHPTVLGNLHRVILFGSRRDRWNSNHPDASRSVLRRFRLACFHAWPRHVHRVTSNSIGTFARDRKACHSSIAITFSSVGCATAILGFSPRIFSEGSSTSRSRRATNAPFFFSWNLPSQGSPSDNLPPGERTPPTTRRGTQCPPFVEYSLALLFPRE